MTKEELISEIFAMPSKDRKEVERMVESFKNRKESVKRKPTKRPFRDEPFFGIWKDREDMKMGSAARVRNLRRGPHWNRLKCDDPR